MECGPRVTSRPGSPRRPVVTCTGRLAALCWAPRWHKCWTYDTGKPGWICAAGSVSPKVLAENGRAPGVVVDNGSNVRASAVLVAVGARLQRVCVRRAGDRTGARAVHPPALGAGLAGAQGPHDLPDALRPREVLARGGRLVVVGAGSVGAGWPPWRPRSGRLIRNSAKEGIGALQCHPWPVEFDLDHAPEEISQHYRGRSTGCGDVRGDRGGRVRRRTMRVMNVHKKQLARVVISQPGRTVAKDPVRMPKRSVQQRAAAVITQVQATEVGFQGGNATEFKCNQVSVMMTSDHSRIHDLKGVADGFFVRGQKIAAVTAPSPVA